MVTIERKIFPQPPTNWWNIIIGDLSSVLSANPEDKVIKLVAIERKIFRDLARNSTGSRSRAAEKKKLKRFSGIIRSDNPTCRLNRNVKHTDAWTNDVLLWRRWTANFTQLHYYSRVYNMYICYWIYFIIAKKNIGYFRNIDIFWISYGRLRRTIWISVLWTYNSWLAIKMRHSSGNCGAKTGNHITCRLQKEKSWMSK